MHWPSPEETPCILSGPPCSVVNWLPPVPTHSGPTIHCFPLPPTTRFKYSTARKVNHRSTTNLSTTNLSTTTGAHVRNDRASARRPHRPKSERTPYPWPPCTG